MDPSTSQVIRYDHNGMGRAVRTPEGFLKVPATIARPGVLTYRFADGTSRRELVLPEELYAPASLDSLAMLPVTNDHPPERVVTTDNIKRVQVGQVGERTHTDGMLGANLLLTDKATMADAVRGKRQVSAGYTCDLEMTGGEWNGERYDAIQRNRRYNHVAIVDTGRAGPDVRLHIDSTDTVGIEAPKEQRNMLKVNIDGVEVELEATQAALVKNALEKRDAAVASAKAAAEAATARADSAKVELEAERKARTDAEDPARLAQAVTARVALVTQASKILGDEVKLDSLSDREIKLAVSAKHAPAQAEAMKSAADSYVAAFYDAAVVSLSQTKSQAAKDVVESVRSDKSDGEKTEKPKSSREARNAFIAKQNANKFEPTKV